MASMESSPQENGRSLQNVPTTPPCVISPLSWKAAYSSEIRKAVAVLAIASQAFQRGPREQDSGPVREPESPQGLPRAAARPRAGDLAEAPCGAARDGASPRPYGRGDREWARLLDAPPRPGGRAVGTRVRGGSGARHSGGTAPAPREDTGEERHAGTGRCRRSTAPGRPVLSRADRERLPPLRGRPGVSPARGSRAPRRRPAGQHRLPQTGDAHGTAGGPSGRPGGIPAGRATSRPHPPSRP